MKLIADQRAVLTLTGKGEASDCIAGRQGGLAEGRRTGENVQQTRAQNPC